MGEFVLVRGSESVWWYALVGGMLIFVAGYAVTLVNLIRHPERVAPVTWSLKSKTIGNRDLREQPSEDDPYGTS